MNPRIRTLTLICFAAALARLLPHAPNFTPIGALALFGGAHFKDLRLAMGVPLASMLLSDVLLALTVYGLAAFSMIPYVYLSFIVVVGLGRLVRTRRGIGPIALGALASSILFFVVTNFGVWLKSTLYPPTFEGLLTCYTTAIPFFRNTVASDALFAAVLFGGFAIAERSFESIRLADSATA